MLPRMSSLSTPFLYFQVFKILLEVHILQQFIGSQKGGPGPLGCLGSACALWQNGLAGTLVNLACGFQCSSWEGQAHDVAACRRLRLVVFFDGACREANCVAQGQASVGVCVRLKADDEPWREV